MRGSLIQTSKHLHFLKSVTFKICSLVGFLPQESDYLKIGLSCG